MIFDWKTGSQRYRLYLTELRTLTKRKDVRSYFNLTLTFLTVAFFGFFAIRPTLIIIAKLVKEIEEKEEINHQLDKKIASLVSAQEQYSANQERFYLLDQALPKIPDFPSLIYCLENIASSTNVEFKSFSISKIDISGETKSKITPKKASSFEFNLSLTGSFQNLQQFVHQAESLRRLIFLKSISFGKPKKTQEEENQILLTISGDTNYYESKFNE